MNNKIAFQVDDQGVIVGLTIEYDPSNLPSGWQEAETDPYFNISNMDEWTVKEGKLVKKDSGMSPIEENREAITGLTQLSGQTQQAVTKLTQLTGQTQEAITQLTQLMATQTANNSKEEN